MLMQEERELVVEYGKKMSADRLSTGTSGNISIYNAEKGLMAISPSGMDYFSTTPEDVVITDRAEDFVQFVFDQVAERQRAEEAFYGTLDYETGELT